MDMALASYREQLKERTVANYIEPCFRFRRHDEDDQPRRLSFEGLIAHLGESGCRTWFVLGPSGSGKTSLAHQAAIALVERAIFPVFVNATDLELQWREDFTAEQFALAARPASIDEAQWRQGVSDRRCVFIVDAANELQRMLGVSEQWRFVRNVLCGNHSFAVLATSRYPLEELDETRLRNVETLLLEDLSDEQVKAYLTTRGSADVDDCLRDFAAAGMDHAARNPYLLKLLADLLDYQKGPSGRRSIPRTRAELLLATVARAPEEHRLTKDEIRLGRATGLTMEAVLCAASLTLFVIGKQEARVTDLESLLARVWDDPHAVTQAVEAFFHTQMADRFDRDHNQWFRLRHDSLRDFGLALGWRNTTPPEFVFHPGHLEHCAADWMALDPQGDGGQHDCNEIACEYLEDLADARAYTLMIDVVTANRGRLSEDTRGEYWEAIGQGLAEPESDSARRLADLLSGLPKSLLFEGAHCGVLAALVQHVSRLPRGMSQAPDHEGRKDANKFLLKEVVEPFLTRRLDATGLQKVLRQAQSRRHRQRPSRDRA